MNGIALFVISTFAMTSISVRCYANDDASTNLELSRYIYDSDMKEIQELKGLKSDVYDAVNSWKDYSEQEINEEINIDWNLLTKQYIYDSFLNSAMDSDPYGHIWVLPVPLGSHTVEVVYNKIQPLDEKAKEYLTDKEVAELQQRVGTWMVIDSTLHSDPLNYQKEINDVLVKNDLTQEPYGYFVLTAIPGGRYPMTVVTKDNSPIYIFPALSTSCKHFIDNYVPEYYHNQNSIYEFNNTLKQLKQYMIDGSTPAIIPVQTAK